MTLSNEMLCGRVRHGIGRMLARGEAIDFVVVVVNSEDWDELVKEWRDVTGDLFGEVEGMEVDAEVITEHGDLTVFGLPVHTDERLKPGEIRLRTDVLV
jgi:hypothetical protein